MSRRRPSSPAEPERANHPKAESAFDDRAPRPNFFEGSAAAAEKLIEMGTSRGAALAVARPGSGSISVPTRTAAPARAPAAPPEAAGALDLKMAFFEHAVRLQRFFTRIGVSTAEAEDLTSETFLVAYEKQDRFDQSRPLLPWLFGIAAHLLRRHRRRAWLRTLVGLAVAREADPPDLSSTDLERTLLEAEDALRVRKTLAAMPRKKRVLLVLREYEGLSAQEIGAVLEMPVESVYSALHYARKEFLRRYRQQLFLEASR